MGCASSNQEDAKDAKAKANGNGAGGGGADAENEPVAPKQNPYMTLTHKDTFHLKMSWKGIRRSLEETGITMFMKLFEANPEFKSYFEKFKHLENAVLIKSQVLENHATAVMEAIDIAITEIDDAEKTHTKLKKLGLEHKARGVKVDHIDGIRDPFLKSVEQTLGDRYSDRMRNIYEGFIDYLLKAIKEGYDS